MFGLGKHGPDATYAAIIDIGSGSVGLAIIASEPGTPAPHIIWSTREHAADTAASEREQPGTVSTKKITTTILNAMLLLGSTGIKKLATYDHTAKITTIQFTVSAPWSYTISKSITFEDKNPFTISKKLISELIDTAQQQAIEAIDEPAVVERIGLEVINRSTIGVDVNGYNITKPYDKDGNRITLTHVSGLTRARLVKEIYDHQAKVLPKTESRLYTFMLVYYCVVRELVPSTAEICLIDITNEATEIGIIRGNLLKYVTHIPIGKNWIIHELQAKLNVPRAEIEAYLKNPDTVENLSAKKQADMLRVTSAYEEKIADLYHRTGDNLAIPRTIFLHVDTHFESFFTERLQKGAEKATGSDHAIHLITSKLLKQTSQHTDSAVDAADSAILVAAQFFHKKHKCSNYDIL